MDALPRLDTADFAALELFITGPTYIRPEVKRAATLPEFGHRDAEAAKRFDPIFMHLRTVAGLPPDSAIQPAILNGSGTNAMECAVRSLVNDDETILAVTMGAFGALFHKLAQVNGKRVVELAFAPGETVAMDRLAAALKEHTPALVLLTHNETSTGVTSDIAQGVALAHEHGALAAVDGVSLFGGVALEMASINPDFYATATQKCLALPAGFGIAFVGPDAAAKAERVERRGYITDLLAHLEKAAKGQTLTTPNTALANQLAVQLDHIVHEEGVANRAARHLAMRDMVAEFVATLEGFDRLAPAAFASPSLTAVQAPAGASVADLKALKETMRAKGFLFDPGYGKLNTALEREHKRPIFRIGHMGDVQPAMLERYLEALRPALQALATTAASRS